MNVEDWQRVATGWERHRAWIQGSNLPVSERMVELLDPQPASTVLEVAAGVGDTGFLAAARGARLISTDFAPAMVEAARRRAAELGVEDAEFRVMDAARLELPDGSVDGVLCRYGYMLVADPAAALAEARRVLRAGGRLSFAVWDESEKNPWATTFGRAMIDRGYVEPPEPGTPGPFALADRGRIAELVDGAGFSSHVVEEVPVQNAYVAVDDYLRVIFDLAATSSAIVAALPPEERAALRADIAARLEPFRDGDVFVVPGAALVVAAS